MVWTDQQCSSLEGKSLMALCLLAHEHGVNTDGCETKAEVIQALLAAGKAVGGVLPSDVVPSRAAPAWGGDRSPDIRAAVEEPSSKRFRTTTGAAISMPAAAGACPPAEEERPDMTNTPDRASTLLHGVTSASPSEGRTPSKRMKGTPAGASSTLRVAASPTPREERSAVTTTITTTTATQTSSSRRGAVASSPRGDRSSTTTNAAVRTSVSSHGAVSSLPQNERSSTNTTATRTSASHRGAIASPSQRRRSTMTNAAAGTAISPRGAVSSLPQNQRSSTTTNTTATATATRTACLRRVAAASPPQVDPSSIANNAAARTSNPPRGAGVSLTAEEERPHIPIAATSVPTAASIPEERRSYLTITNVVAWSSTSRRGAVGSLQQQERSVITSPAARASTSTGSSALEGCARSKRSRETLGSSSSTREPGSSTAEEETWTSMTINTAAGTTTTSFRGAAVVKPTEECAPSKRLRETPGDAAPDEAGSTTPPQEKEEEAEEVEEEEEEYTAMTDPTALRSLAQFVPDTQFLFFATVCRGWRAAWGARPTLTSHVSPDSSLSQLRYSIANGLPKHGVDLCTSLARLGKLDLVRYSRTKGYRYHWNWRTTATLARVGDLKLLKMAVRNGCEWNETTTASAAWGGHVDVLRWALKHGCPYDATLCAGAARGGHLSILRGARKRGFPWDARTTMWAAAGGHILVLKWARRNGCRWRLKKCYRNADKHGQGHVMEWIEKLRRWCASGSSEMLVVGQKKKAAAAATVAAGH